MTNETNEHLDAEQFKNSLIARINAGDEEGQQIALYLDSIVPDWMVMSTTRLYKYIQDMLKNAEENRRSEKENRWKRMGYLTTLIVAFFSAFAYLLDVTQGGFWFFDASDIEFSEEEKISYTLLSIIVTFAVAFLFFSLANISKHNYCEQENWEHQINSLQAILGINLMREFLKKDAKYSLLKEADVIVSVFIFRIFSAMTILLASRLAVFSLDIKCKEIELIFLFFCPTNAVMFLIAIVFLLLLLKLIHNMLFIAKSFSGESDANLKSDMNILYFLALFFILLKLIPMIAIALQ